MIHLLPHLEKLKNIESGESIPFLL